MLKAAKFVCLMALTFALVCAGFALLELRNAAIELESTERSVTAALDRIDVQVVEISAHLNRLLDKTGRTVAVVQEAAQSQSDYWTDTAQESLNLVGSATKAIDHLTVVVDKAGTTVDAGTATINKIQPVIAHLDSAAEGLEKATNDTEIHDSMVAAHKAADEIGGMASDGHRVTKHYADAITAPKRWYQKLAGFIQFGGGIAAKALIP